MKLQINDKIYESNNYYIERIHKIIRTTNTLAIADTGDKFKIDIEDGCCYKIEKKNIWSKPQNFHVETTELKERFQKERLVYKIKKFDFNKLNLENLLKINSIIN